MKWPIWSWGFSSLEFPDLLPVLTRLCSIIKLRAHSFTYFSELSFIYPGGPWVKIEVGHVVHLIPLHEREREEITKK